MDIVGSVTTYTSGPEALHQARRALQSATHALLGATIQVRDEAWAAPSALPGWSRAELAAHLARHADALRGLVEGALRGEVVPLYPSEQTRQDDIRAGARRTGLEVQEDLDSACGRLEGTFDDIEDWTVPVDFRGQALTLAALPAARLAEVLVHHVDLAIGQTFDDIDPTDAALALDWAASRIATRPGAPHLHLVADSGPSWILPGQGDLRKVTGPAPRLLGWLAGRLDAEGLAGADGVDVPSW